MNIGMQQWLEFASEPLADTLGRAMIAAARGTVRANAPASAGDCNAQRPELSLHRNIVERDNRHA